MILENAKKQRIEHIISVMSKKIVKQPIFMYYCPIVKERENFIKAYLGYYVYEWAEYDTLFCSDDDNVLIPLVNPRTYEYRFKGKGAHALKKQKEMAQRILSHRRIVREIVHILAPSTVMPRVMRIYANAEEDMADIKKLIGEVCEHAQENQYTLVYETFSKKYTEVLEEYGFVVSYKKAFGDTRFIQTIMVKYPYKTKDDDCEPNEKDGDNNAEY